MSLIDISFCNCLRLTTYAQGSTYTMVNPNEWHAVYPDTSEIFTVMLTWKPYARAKQNQASKPLSSLADERKAELLNKFKSLLIN